MTPVFRKDDPTKAKNHTPVRALAGISKTTKAREHKFLHWPISVPLHVCLWKGFQYPTRTFVSHWKMEKVAGYGGGNSNWSFKSLCDTINHDLLIAKLRAYCFSKQLLRLIKSYLINRWQRTKLNIFLHVF